MSLSQNFPTLRPSLLLDFANSGRLDPRVTFTRASSATYFDETGVLQTATTDAPRFDYDPSTLAAQGLLIEESRTNSIRNNTMQGAVAGTPGTLPTNWIFITGGAATYEVIGTGTENGITYADIRFQGSSASDTWNLITESTTQIVAANGQTWASTFYLKVVAGALTNLALTTRLLFRTVAGAAVVGNDVSATPTSAALNTQRFTNVFTASGATIERVTNAVNSGTPTGAFDITLRIGLPQLEIGVGSSVNSGTASGTTTAVVLSAGSATDDVYNGYTLFVNGEYRTITDYVGSTKTATVAALTASPSGSYTVLQPASAAFATSVIPTTSAAVTRAADVASVNTLSPWYNAAEGTLYAEWQMSSSAAAVFAINDNSSNNRIQVSNQGSTAVIQSIIWTGGVSQFDATSGSFLLNGNAKGALAYKTNDVAFSANGGAVVTDTSATIPTVSQVQFGFRAGSSSYLNSYIRRVTYYPRRLSNAELQAITS
jgi:hypothetical protein